MELIWEQQVKDQLQLTISLLIFPWKWVNKLKKTKKNKKNQKNQKKSNKNKNKFIQNHQLPVTHYLTGYNSNGAGIIAGQFSNGLKIFNNYVERCGYSGNASPQII